MEKVELHAHVREEFGKAAVGRLRRDGLIPAVVYKHGEKPTAMKLLKKDFLKTLHTKAGENVIITLKIAKAKDTDKPRTTSKTVLIKEIQENPVSDDIIHIDFNEISLTEMIKVKVPIAEKGEAVGVKRDEGILEHILWEVEVECLPTQIPEKLEVDVSNLEIGQDIFIKDIAVPEGVKILEDSEAIVFSVKTPKAEEIPTPEEAAADTAQQRGFGSR
jgi:large subunit ribosomal protein L25